MKCRIIWWQDDIISSVRPDGLKRSLHSIESSNYPMVEATTGIMVEKSSFRLKRVLKLNDAMLFMTRAFVIFR